MADKAVLNITGEDVAVQRDKDGAVTAYLGDGIRIRILPNGTVRVRSINHTVQVAWLTNKPEAGQQSVLGLELTRKD